MDHALDNRMDHRIDRRTSRRARYLFAAVFLAAALLSPYLVLWELLAGAAGLVATGLLARRAQDGAATMTATVVFAGLLAGSLPYLVAAPFVS
ncbi:hypothetical protein [Streptomyces sp. RFCAC02]|uniref:hypothetical protein n=1 Tax=Streptomyces sp. RFCAC02 TaxID=2499143 RepID=UPI0010203882|nr:hypothetical protein [Streptomyces sp. RFCAC02]